MGGLHKEGFLPPPLFSIRINTRIASRDTKKHVGHFIILAVPHHSILDLNMAFAIVDILYFSISKASGRRHKMGPNSWISESLFDRPCFIEDLHPYTNPCLCVI